MLDTTIDWYKQNQPDKFEAFVEKSRKDFLKNTASKEQ